MIHSTPIPICEGIGSHVFGLAERLRERGHEVIIMTRGNLWEKEEFERDGFRVIKVPFYPIYPFHVYFHRYFLSASGNILLSACQRSCLAWDQLCYGTASPRSQK